MKEKTPFYKNGLIVCILLMVVGILVAAINSRFGSAIFMIGLYALPIALIVRIVRWFKSKPRRQTTDTATPLQAAPTGNTEPVSVPSVTEPVRLPVQESLVRSEVTPAPTGNDSSDRSMPAAAGDGAIQAAQVFRKLSIPEFIRAAQKSGFIAFDFETTGFNSNTDRITEMGAIKLDAGGNEVDHFSMLVNPQMHIPSSVAQKTGIKDSMVRTAPAIEQVLPDFLAFVEGLPMIAYNASFDKGFLEKAARRCNIGCTVQYADALEWARRTYKLDSYKQGLVAEHIGCKPVVEHRAIQDCETLVTIIKDMQSQPCNDLQSSGPVQLTAADAADSANDCGANPEERAIARHFIEIIKDRKPDARPKLERRAQAYLSLCQGDNDFLRIKYTNRARWISIDAYGAQIEEDDPLFEAQKNKLQRHWKAKIADLSEITKFDEYVIRACK